ncbi:MAG: molybdenum cofactor biosynthesis protein MoaE [Candidatus Methanomethylicia archaeon]
MSNVFIGDVRNIDLNDFIRYLKGSSPNVGCILLFIGFVRSEGFDGGSVSKLHYEAYEELVKLELNRIVSDACKVDGVYSVGIMHMIGDALPGEKTFIVGVAAKHREEGFKVLREVVERVKGEVHIWKKEITDKGEYWLSNKP